MATSVPYLGAPEARNRVFKCSAAAELPGWRPCRYGGTTKRRSGAEITVPTLDGRVSLRIPSESQNRAGDALLRDAGLPWTRAREAAGDCFDNQVLAVRHDHRPMKSAT